MKRNELTRIKGLDLKQLVTQAKSARGKIANLVMDKNITKIKDLKIISKKRRDLAQILTITRQKQLLEELESKRNNPTSSEQMSHKESKK